MLQAGGARIDRCQSSRDGGGVRIQAAAFRVNHLQASIALAYLAKATQSYTRLAEQLLLSRTEVKKAQNQCAGGVTQAADQKTPTAHRHFAADDFSLDLGFRTRNQLPDGGDAGAVLIAQRQMQQHVLGVMDTEPAQPFGKSGADPRQGDDRQRLAGQRSGDVPPIGFCASLDSAGVHARRRSVLQHQHGVHLDLGSAWQVGDADSGSGGKRLWEMIGHDLIHQCEMAQVG